MQTMTAKRMENPAHIAAPRRLQCDTAPIGRESRKVDCPDRAARAGVRCGSSQINGCAACVYGHVTHALRQLGASAQERIDYRRGLAAFALLQLKSEAAGAGADRIRHPHGGQHGASRSTTQLWEPRARLQFDEPGAGGAHRRGRADQLLQPRSMSPSRNQPESPGK